jgi:hypothetical protein
MVAQQRCSAVSITTPNVYSRASVTQKTCRHAEQLCEPQVDELPEKDIQTRKSVLSSLTAEPPSKELWQAGGSTNFMISASRLGLDVRCCGHVADDVFGSFLMKCLEVRFS